MIPFGNMDQWIDRQIKESGIIGGATKNVYAIGPTATVTETLSLIHISKLTNFFETLFGISVFL